MNTSIHSCIKGRHSMNYTSSMVGRNLWLGSRWEKWKTHSLFRSVKGFIWIFRFPLKTVPSSVFHFPRSEKKIGRKQMSPRMIKYCGRWKSNTTPKLLLSVDGIYSRGTFNEWDSEKWYQLLWRRIACVRLLFWYVL